MATLLPEFEPGNGAGNLKLKKTVDLGGGGVEGARVKNSSNE